MAFGGGGGEGFAVGAVGGEAAGFGEALFGEGSGSDAEGVAVEDEGDVFGRSVFSGFAGEVSATVFVFAEPGVGGKGFGDVFAAGFDAGEKVEREFEGEFGAAALDLVLRVDADDDDGAALVGDEVGEAFFPGVAEKAEEFTGGFFFAGEFHGDGLDGFNQRGDVEAEIEDEVGVGGGELSGLERLGFAGEEGEETCAAGRCVEEEAVIVAAGDGVGAETEGADLGKADGFEGAGEIDGFIGEGGGLECIGKFATDLAPAGFEVDVGVEKGVGREFAADGVEGIGVRRGAGLGESGGGQECDRGGEFEGANQ